MDALNWLRLVGWSYWVSLLSWPLASLLPQDMTFPVKFGLLLGLSLGLWPLTSRLLALTRTSHMAAPVVDFLLQHAMEITSVELEVDQTWNAVQDADNGQLARDLLANGLNEEHFVASLDPDPSKRTPDQLATLAKLHGITQAFLAQARVFLAGHVDQR